MNKSRRFFKAASQHRAVGKAGKAFEEGRAAKAAGKNFCPYRIGTRSYEEWFRGWQTE